MKHSFQKLFLHKVIISFCLLFTTSGILVIDQNILEAEAYGYCPGCGAWCPKRIFCDKKNSKSQTSSKSEPSKVVYYAQDIKQAQEVTEAREVEKKLTEHHKKKEEKKEKKADIKRRIEENKKIWAKEEAEEKRAQEEGKKQVEEKLKQNEPLTREEDEQFNEGKERKAEIEEYIEKLNLEGKEQIAKAMQEFLKNPREALLSQEARDYFGKGVQQFNYGTEDLVDNSIVDAIDNSTKILKQLERPGILNSNFIVEQLKQSLVMGDTALAKQADFLSSKNSVEAALNTTSLINSISNLAQGFFTGVYERGCEIANTIYSAGAKVIGAITHMATHPQAMLEKVGCLMMEAESPDILNAMCEVSPVIAQKRKEAMQSVDNKLYKPIEASIESAANFVGKVGNNLIEFSKEYGAAFYTSEDFLGLPEQTCKSMLSEQQHCQQKLKEAINTYAQKVTAEGVGKVAGSVAADIGAFYLGEKIVGTVANKVGGTVSSSAKAETLAATAREVETATLPSISHAIQEVPIITEELSGYVQGVHQTINNEIVSSSAYAIEADLVETAAYEELIVESPLANAEAAVLEEAGIVKTKLANTHPLHSEQPFLQESTTTAYHISSQHIVDEKAQLVVNDKPILEKKSGANRLHNSSQSCPTPEQIAEREAEALAKKLLKKQLQQIEQGIIPLEIRAQKFYIMTQDLHKLLLKSTKFSRENVNLVIAHINKNKHLIVGNKLSLNAQAVLEYGNTFPRLITEHFMEGEIVIENGIKQFKGLHTALSKPHSIKEIIKSRNQHGVYEAIVQSECGILKKRPSSFFPDHWSKEKIIQKIEEAFYNPIEELPYGKIGITKEGIKIKMWFKETTINGKKTLVLINAYPLYE